MKIKQPAYIKIDNKFIKMLLKNEFFFTQKYKNVKLNKITKSYIEDNPIRMFFRNGHYSIIDGRHRIFMAIAVYKMGSIPCYVEED